MIGKRGRNKHESEVLREMISKDESFQNCF